MNLEEILNIHLLFSAVLLVAFIGCIIFFYRLIKSLNRKQQSLNSQNFALLTRKTNDHLDRLGKAFSSLIESNNAELANLKAANAAFTTAQQQTFAQFLEVLKIDYSSYVQEVQKTNNHLLQVTDLMRTSISNFDGVKSTLQKKYETLASLTDKTAELISDNEEAISDFRQWSESTFTTLQSSAQNRFADLVAEGEINLSDTVENNVSQLRAITDQSKEFIESLFDTTHFKNFENDVTALSTVKDQFTSSANDILKEMEGIKTQIKMELEAAKTKDGKGFFGFLKS